MNSIKTFEIMNVTIQEMFACFSLPGTALTSDILQKALEKKVSQAREILLEEIGQGSVPEIGEDDVVYITYR